VIRARAAAALLALALPLPARSQPAGSSPSVVPSPPAVEEITVRARQRPESIQAVPVAVTAYDAEFVAETYTETVSDLERYLANVELSDLHFSGNALGAAIRGVGFFDLEKTYEPAVGVSIDGIFLGTNTGAAIDVFDLESVEVLRGPQGTLFGRNTIGGTINLRRSRPTGALGARLGVRIGRHDQRDVQLVVNTPRIAGLAAKLAYFRNADRLFTESQVPGVGDEGQDLNQYGGALSWQPSEAFDALLSLDWIDDDSHFPPNLSLTKSSPGNADGNFCDLTLTLFASDAGCDTASYLPSKGSGFRKSFPALPFLNRIDGFSGTLELHAHLAGLELTSLTGYRESSELLREENTGGPPVAVAPGVSVPIFVADRDQDYEQWSQELRASGRFADRLDLVAGLYFLHTDYDIRPGGGLPGVPPAQIYVLGAPLQVFTASQRLDSYAVFAEGTLDLVDRLSLTAGFRYTIEEKRFTTDHTNDPLGAFVFSGTESWDEPTFRVALDYRVTPDLMTYASWSRGFRSGGWNGRATSLASVGPYDPEIVDSFELGLRTEWWAHRVRLNPTLFFVRYADKQEEVLHPVAGGGTETIVENAARVDIYGLELEALAALTDDLALRVALGALRGDYRDYHAFDPATGRVEDVSDTAELRRAPRWNANAGLRYSHPIRRTTLTLNANWRWTDDFFTSDTTFGRDPYGRDETDSFHVADLSASLEVPTEGHIPGLEAVSVTGFVKDVFNPNVGRLGPTLDTGAFFFGIPEVGRTYGLELAFAF
jgi:iron complex outermembrane receptor protein